MPVSKTALRWITVIVVFLAIVAFAALFGAAIAQVWTAAAGKPPQYSQPYLYVATALAALVGGIFAVAFGVKTPDPKTNLSTQQLNVHTLASAPGQPPMVSIAVGTLYLIVYLALGIAALVSWVIHPSEISDLVKNLGSTFLGLALPIVRAFFDTGS